MSPLLRDTRSLVRRLVGASAAGRSLTVWPDDTFLVSYPRSGNTWLRFALSKLVDVNRTVDFLSIEKDVPDIYACSDRALRRLPRPRMLKSHEPFDHRYGRVILLIRDPRDVVVSYYRYQVKMGLVSTDCSGPRYLQLFLDGLVDGWGTWAEHTEGWLKARSGDVRFLRLRYEDVLSERFLTTEHLCQFLNLSRSATEIREVITSSERKAMQELEQDQHKHSSLLRSRRSEVPFVGEGRSGLPIDHNDEYLRSHEARIHIEERFGELMGQLGYN